MLSICLNPAWQKTLLFEDFYVGAVNRANTLRECGGGKGVNLARALRLADSDVRVALFAGGATGDLHIGACTVPTEVATRTCTTLINQRTGQVTEVIEPSGEIAHKEVQAMRKALGQAIRSAKGVAICGTYPPGVPESVYAEAVHEARRRGLPTVLDAYHGVRQALAVGPTILKINADELRHLTNRANVEDAALDCLALYAVEMVAITDGPRPAFLFSRHECWQFDQPELRVRSAIGAGDCASAILLRELVANQPPHEAFRRALAAANASCLTETPSQFDPRQAEVIAEQILVQQL
jgi:tagatose 6-phosphate kinase